jgi:hypothetical protein
VRDGEVEKQLPALPPLLQLACPSKFWRPVRSVIIDLTLPPCSFHWPAVKLRGISDKSPAATFDCDYILPWTLALLQSLTSTCGSVAFQPLQTFARSRGISKHAPMGLAVRPFSAFITGSPRDPTMRIDLRLFSLVGPLSKNPVGGSSGDVRRFTAGLRCVLRLSQPLDALRLPMHPGHISVRSHSWGSRPSEVSPLWLPTFDGVITKFDFLFRGCLPRSTGFQATRLLVSRRWAVSRTVV